MFGLRASAVKVRATRLVQRARRVLSGRIEARLSLVPPRSLPPTIWQRLLLIVRRKASIVLRERQLDLIVGVRKEDAPIVKAWLAGRAGCSVVLVLQHEGLRDADFGCDVFTQHELIPPASEAAALIAADCERGLQGLCDRLEHVRLGEIEVASDAVREALPSAHRTTEIARAAKALLARGYNHVVVVLTAYLHMDGALIEEAKTCGLADAGATALCARDGRLSRLSELTLRTAPSKPADWAAAFLRRLEPVHESPSEFVALGFSDTSRLRKLSAVVDELLKLCADDRRGSPGDNASGTATAPFRLTVIPELIVADPRAVAQVLQRLLDAWRRDLATRVAKFDSSWEMLGQHSFEAAEVRTLALEERLKAMLKGIARLERLNAISMQQPELAKVVIDDSANCTFAPERLPDLARTRFFRFPLEWDAVDAEANRKLAFVLKEALDQERASRPVEGPELYVLVGVRLDDVTHVARWLGGLEGRRAVLVARYDELADSQFGCDRFLDLELIPTNSELEEEVYRSCSEHRDRRQAQLAATDFLGVPLSLDFFRAVAAPVERLMIMMRAARLLFERGYAHVAIVCGPANDHYGCLILEGRACGVLRANDTARRVVRGKIQTDHAFSTPSLLKSARQHVSQLSSIAPVASSPAQVLVVALSSAPHYLRSGKAVIAALKEHERHVLLVVPRREGFGWAEEIGVRTEALAPAGVPARYLEALNTASDEFLRALGDLARADLAARPKLRWRQLGHMTSEFHDLHASTRDVVSGAMFRHLIMICRLDEIVATVKPDIIYKFPSSATIMDGSLLAIARKYGIRQVASVFLSLSASFRDMDRAPQDIITVLGEEQAEIVGRNIRANEVIALGQPEMDLFMHGWAPETSREHVLRMIPAWDGKKRLVVVATSNFDASREPIWVRELCRHAAARGDAHVLVKLHPATPIAVYRSNLALDGDFDISLVADVELAPYMQIASVIVTDVSHAGKIAVYLGRPLMVVNISGTPFPYHRYDEDEVALGAFSLPEIGSVLDRLLDGEAPVKGRAGFIRRQFTSDDNRASQRIADLVLSVGRSPAPRESP